MEIKMKREGGNQGNVKEMPPNVTFLPQTLAVDVLLWLLQPLQLENELSGYNSGD